MHFRYVVFRPFLDEVLVGKIRSSSKEGVSGKSRNFLLLFFGQSVTDQTGSIILCMCYNVVILLSWYVFRRMLLTSSVGTSGWSHWGDLLETLPGAPVARDSTPNSKRKCTVWSLTSMYSMSRLGRTHNRVLRIANWSFDTEWDYLKRVGNSKQLTITYNFSDVHVFTISFTKMLLSLK